MARPMTTQRAATVIVTMFTPAERTALRALRRRYSRQRDLLSQREQARLRFIRWLYQTGRLQQ